MKTLWLLLGPRQPYRTKRQLYKLLDESINTLHRVIREKHELERQIERMG
jgi:hypothetical protein